MTDKKREEDKPVGYPVPIREEGSSSHVGEGVSMHFLAKQKEEVMTEIKWERLQPNEDEVKYNLDGIRADHNGAKLTVRVADTETEGPHVVWSVERYHGSAKVKVVGAVQLPNDKQLLSSYELAKQRAVYWAELPGKEKK